MLSNIKNMKLNKGVKTAIILIIVLVLTIFSIVLCKNFYLKRYDNKIKVSKLSIQNKKDYKEESNVSIDNNIKGYDTLNYIIKYKLETEDKKEINGRTAIVEATLSDTEIKYASWNILEKENVTSEITNSGKTLKLVIKNVTTNIENTIEAKLNVVGAPDGFTIKPVIKVYEKTSEENEQTGTPKTELVSTGSISGYVINKEDEKYESEVELKICKTNNGLCENEKKTYTKEDGSYVFTDLEDGTYQIMIVEESKYALASEIPEIKVKQGDVKQNIEVINQGNFRASVKKYIKKVIINNDGKEKVYDYTKVNRALVSVKNTKTANMKILYEFEIKNETDKEGYVKVIKEDIPSGLIFDKTYKENKNWEEIDGKLYNKELSKEKMQPNEIKNIYIMLKAENSETAINYLNKVSITGENYYTVKYVVNNETIKEISVLDSDKTIKYDYEKEGYEFLGWYIDKEFKNEYDFNKPVENDLVLYGKIEKNIVTENCDITYVDKGVVVGKDTIICGETPNIDICDDENNCKKSGYQYECLRDEENPSVCLNNPVITKDIIITTSYIKLPTPIIMHTPTEWTNITEEVYKNSENKKVKVEMKLPTDAKKVINRSIKTIDESGIVTYSEIEEEKEEILNLTTDDYDIKYQIVNEKEYIDESNQFSEYELNNEWNTYIEDFEIIKNSRLVAKIKNKDKNEESTIIEHTILNIDKKAPEIEKQNEPSKTEIVLTGIVNDNQSKADKLEIYYVEGSKINIEEYLSDDTKKDLVQIKTKEFTDEENGNYTITIESLTPNTTYTVGMVAYDKVGNKTEMETEDITTTEEEKIIAKIIGRNDSLFENEELYEPYSSLEKAIVACGEMQCTIQMVDNTTESIIVSEVKNVTLDVNGFTISGLRPNYTIQNNGILIVVDNADVPGKIINSLPDGISLYATTGTLTLGVNEGDVPSITTPNIIATDYGVKKEPNASFNFYDGRIEGRIAIEGEVDRYPDGYSPNIEVDGTQVATLRIIGDAEASIGSKLYTRLDDALKVTETGSYRFEQTQNLTNLVQRNGQYYFEYDESSGRIENNNQKLYGTTAESYIDIDLSDEDKYGTDGVLLIINAKIESENSVGKVYLDEKTVLSISKTVSSQDYSLIVTPGSVNRLKIRYTSNSSSEEDIDTFTINSIRISSFEEPELISNPEIQSLSFGFRKDSESGKIINCNQGIDLNAYSYMKLDLTNRDKYPDDSVILNINAEINSEENIGIGFVYITESETIPLSSSTDGRIVNITGNISAKDYVKTIETGKEYYLHFIYEKNGPTTNEIDTFTINKVELTNIEYGKFTVIDSSATPFDFDDENDILTSTNHTGNSLGSSYIRIDMTEETEMQYLKMTVNISSEQNCDYGYITFSDNTIVPEYYNSTNRVMYISGEVPVDVDTSSPLFPGKINYIHIGYRKDSGGDIGTDNFIVKNFSIGEEKVNLKRIKYIKLENSDDAFSDLVTPQFGYEYNVEDGTIRSNSNNENVDLYSTVKIDLSDTTKYTDDVVLKINGSFVGGSNPIYISENNNNYSPTPDQLLANFSSISTDYWKILKSGKVYYINIKDTKFNQSFIINSISLSNMDDSNIIDYDSKHPILNEEADTVKLLKRINNNSTITIPDNQNIIIDLNGNVLTTIINDYVISNYGTLTITDSTINEDTTSEGQILNTNQSVIYNAKDANLILDKGKINSSKSGNGNYGIYNDGMINSNSNFEIRLNTSNSAVYFGLLGNISGTFNAISNTSSTASSVILNHSQLLTEINNFSVVNKSITYFLDQYTDTTININNLTTSSKIINRNKANLYFINSESSDSIIENKAGTINLENSTFKSIDSKNGSVVMKDSNLTYIFNNENSDFNIKNSNISYGVKNTSGKGEILNSDINSSGNYITGFNNTGGTVNITGGSIKGSTTSFVNNGGTAINLTSVNITNGLSTATGDLVIDNCQLANPNDVIITQVSPKNYTIHSTVEIKNVTINNTTSYPVISNGYYMTIRNSTITGSKANTITTSNNITIIDSHIRNIGNYNAIYTKYGDITLGEKDGVYNKDSVSVISDGSYGIYSDDYDYLNLYDGIIKGKNGKSTYITKNYSEDEYNFVTVDSTKTEDGLEHLILDKISTVELYDENGNKTENQCGDESPKDCYSFDSAINHVPNNGTIKFIKDAYVRVRNNEAVIPEGKKITIDLNGMSVDLLDKFFTNNGEVLLTDSANTVDENGYITNETAKVLDCSGQKYSCYAITNNSGGKITYDKVNFSSKLTQTVDKNGETIINSGNISTVSSNKVTINGGIVNSVRASSCTVEKGKISSMDVGVGDTVINGGEIGKISGSGTSTSTTNITINDGKVSSTSGSAIEGDQYTNIIIHGGEIKSTKTSIIRGVITVESGTLTIDGGTIIDANTSSTYGAINLSEYYSSDVKATFNMSGGEIISNNGQGIYLRDNPTVVITGGKILSKKEGLYGLSDSKATFGIKDGNVSTISPEIISTDSYAVSIGKTNFYDGIFKTKSSFDAIKSTISDLESGYDNIQEKNKMYTNEEGEAEYYNVAYLGQAPKLKNVTTNTDYYDVNTAIAEANENDELKLLRSFQIASDEKLIVDNDKKLTIDFDDYSLIGNADTLENNGNLILKGKNKDGGDFNKCVIKNNTGATLNITNLYMDSCRVTNYGNLSVSESTIESGNLTSSMESFTNKGTADISFVSNNYNPRISNSGTINLKNGNITTFINSGTSTLEEGYINLVSNTGNLTIEGGTVKSLSTNYGKVFINNGNVYEIESKGGTNFEINGGEIGRYASVDINNSYNGPNDGTGNSIVTINGGTIYNTIKLQQDDSLTVNGGNFESYGPCISGSKGTITINGGNFESHAEKLYSVIAAKDITLKNLTITGGYYGIKSNGTVTMVSGTISNSVNGISSTNLILGEEDGVISTEVPSIKASSIGISTSKLKIYDGIIKAPTAITTNTYIEDEEENYDLVVEDKTTTSDNLEHAYLSNEAAITILDSNGEPTELQCGDEQSKKCIYIKDAFAKVKNNETIKLLRNIVPWYTASSYIVNENTNITIDANGFNASFDNLENHGHVIFIDSKNSLDSNGLITNSDVGAIKFKKIDNSNELEFTSAKVIFKEIDSSNTININGGKLGDSSSSYYNILNHSGTVNINSGQLEYGSISNYNGGTININGGDMSYKTYDSWNRAIYTSFINSSCSDATCYIYSNDGNIAQLSNSNDSNGTIIIRNGTINNILNTNGSVESTGGNIGSVDNYSNYSIAGGEINTYNNNSSIQITISNGTINNFNNKNVNAIAIQENGLIKKLNNTNGTFTINRGTCNSISNSANLIISGGTISNTSGSAITNSGTVTIGTYDSNVSITTPTISGSTYGINSTGIVNFYDGIITGATNQSIYGTVTPLSGYKINTVPNKNEAGENDGTESSFLITDDEVAKVVSYNGINYPDIQSAVNAAAGKTAEMRLEHDFSLTSNVVVPADTIINFYLNGNTIQYNEYTISGEGTFNIMDGTNTSSLLGTIIGIFNKNNENGKNIIIYEMDDGSKLDINKEYILYKYENDKYNKVNVKAELDNVGRYNIDSNKNDKMTTIDGKLYLNNIEEGNYKIVDNNNKEVIFKVESDGTLTGNIKENYTKNFNKIMSTAYAELIVTIQTGIIQSKYFILLTLLSIVGILIYIVKRKAIKD